MQAQHAAAEAAATGAEPGAASAPVETFPIDTNAQLQLVFQYYCRFGRTGGHSGEDTLDNVNWAKFARECPRLVDRRLDRTEVDLIFTKVKTRGKRRLTYSQWLDALSACAAVKFPREDPATAFSLLLARFVFNCPASQGVGALARAGQLDLHAMTAGAGPHATMHPSAGVSGGGVTYLHQPPAAQAHPPPPPMNHREVELAETPSATYVPSAGSSLQLGPPPPPTGMPSPGVVRGTRQAPPTPGTAAATAQFTTAAAAHASHRAAAAAQGGGTSDPHAAMLAAAASGTWGGGQPALQPSPGGMTGQWPEGAADRSVRRPGSARHGTVRTPVRYGTTGYRPTVAGEANVSGGVYDRLSSPASFTGVYRRAYLTDGRMNAFTETGVSAMTSKYEGSTNTGSNETIRNISHLLRPNLKHGRYFK